VMGRAEAMNWKPDSYTSTFLTNNLNLAAAIAAIGVLREEQLAGRAAAIGPAGLARMKSALAGIEGVREVRGLGLWYAAELADAAWAGRAVKLARERGVIVGRSGYEDNVIKLSPALVIPEADLHAGIDKVAGAIRDSQGAAA